MVSEYTHIAHSQFSVRMSDSISRRQNYQFFFLFYIALKRWRHSWFHELNWNILSETLLFIILWKLYPPTNSTENGVTLYLFYLMSGNWRYCDAICGAADDFGSPHRNANFNVRTAQSNAMNRIGVGGGGITINTMEWALCNPRNRWNPLSTLYASINGYNETCTAHQPLAILRCHFYSQIINIIILNETFGSSTRKTHWQRCDNIHILMKLFRCARNTQRHHRKYLYLRENSIIGNAVSCEICILVRPDA